MKIREEFNNYRRYATRYTSRNDSFQERLKPSRAGRPRPDTAPASDPHGQRPTKDSLKGACAGAVVSFKKK